MSLFWVLLGGFLLGAGVVSMRMLGATPAILWMIGIGIICVLIGEVS